MYVFASLATFSSTKKKNLVPIALILAALLAGGCAKQGAPKSAAPVPVKAMQVIQKDTPVTYEFVGEIEAFEEVKIQSKIAGNIVSKMVTGGTTVRKGQPLFQIDPRSVTNTMLDAEAQLASAIAYHSQQKLNLTRSRALASQDAIAQASLDQAITAEEQAAAQVSSARAKLDSARADIDYALVTSPLDGRIDIKDLSVGNFVQPGQTVLATVSSVDPVRVRFSMSENEYLRFVRAAMSGTANENELSGNIHLILGDGIEYPWTGTIDQVDRALTQNTGTLTLKAKFPNSQHILVPGMFARVVVHDEMRKGALLIPQRAIQEVMGKNFVSIIKEGELSETVPVKLGVKIGNLQLVEEGLTSNDRVIVEGFIKAPPDTPVQATMIKPEDLQTPAKQ